VVGRVLLGGVGVHWLRSTAAEDIGVFCFFVFLALGVAGEIWCLGVRVVIGYGGKLKNLTGKEEEEEERRRKKEEGRRKMEKTQK